MNRNTLKIKTSLLISTYSEVIIRLFIDISAFRLRPRASIKKGILFLNN